MAPSNDSSTFGATILPPAERQNNALVPTTTLDSPSLTPAVSRDDISADYNTSATSQVSYEQAHSRQNSKEHVAIFEKDLESGHGTPYDKDNPFTNSRTVEVNKECKMWPSKQTLMTQKIAEKQKRRARQGCAGCGMLKDRWAKLSKKQQLGIRLALALFVIGAIVAVCVGISVAVHGSYYSGAQRQQQVGQ